MALGCEVESGHDGKALIYYSHRRAALLERPMVQYNSSPSLSQNSCKDAALSDYIRAGVQMSPLAKGFTFLG